MPVFVRFLADVCMCCDVLLASHFCSVCICVFSQSRFPVAALQVYCACCRNSLMALSCAPCYSVNMIYATMTSYGELHISWAACGDVVMFAAASQLSAARFETICKHATVSHDPTEDHVL